MLVVGRVFHIMLTILTIMVIFSSFLQGAFDHIHMLICP